jgi:hypothetical protein
VARFTFQPRIRFVNELRLPPSFYRIRVPPGLSEHSVPQPIFVSPQRMLQLLRSRSQSNPSGNLGVPHGLTTAEFSLAFSAFANQWRQVPTPAATPTWVFQGGDIILEVAIGLYVLEGDRPIPNDAPSEEIYRIIVEHELLHVSDEIDIIRNWFPPVATRDAKVQQFLAQSQPLDGPTFQHWFRGAGFQQWLEHDWAQEHNRRNALRDTSAEYRRLTEQIDAQRRRYITR